MHKYISISILFVLFALNGVAQNNTSSPYSVFGIGNLENVAFGRNMAIGGTGYGIRDSRYLNLKNPASLTAIDSLSVLFEMGTFVKLTQNSTNEKSNYYYDGNLSHMVMGHRITPWLMGGFGIMPYSNIGYNFKTLKTLEGENSQVLTTWIGSGGINRMYYSLGLKVSKNFSLGGEVGYLYGPLNEKRTSTTSVQTQNPTFYIINTRYGAMSLKGAFQFSANLDKKGTKLTLGGVVSPSQKFTGKSFVAVQQQYSSTATVTVFSNEEKAKPIYYPTTYGVGGSFILKGQYMLAADYEMANWSMNSGRQYIDQSVYSVGFERLPQDERAFFKRCSYRVGFRYDSGYFTSKDRAIDDMRMSLGMAFPLKNSQSTINATIEAGQRGTTSLGLIRERYTQLSLAFSFHDYWFIKRKIK